MSFDPTTITLRDEIRLAVGDTSGITGQEDYPDETYDAAIDRYTNWKRAAAEMATAIAVKLDRKATSLTAQGDGSLGFGDRAKTLREEAKRWRAEADAEDATGDGKIGLYTIKVVSSLAGDAS